MKTCWLLPIIFLLGNCIYAEFEDHLKKIFNKTDGHSLNGIDFIYMINLDQRPEKWQLSLNQLKPYGITPLRFSAVNGWELSFETITDVGVVFSPPMEGNFPGARFYFDQKLERSVELIGEYGMTYFAEETVPGPIGIALSHISVLKDAYDSGYETIWVMEDDIFVRKDPRIILDLIDELDILVGKDHWDVLFTDQEILSVDGVRVPAFFATPRLGINIRAKHYNFHENQKISANLRKIGVRFGATSMIIRRSGIKKLLDHFLENHLFLPYDMEYMLPKQIQLYTVFEDVVTNLPKSISDNSAPFYKNKQIGAP